MKPAGLLLTLAFVLTTSPVMAHAPVPGVGGFLGGLLHPLFVPGHTLALLGLGLLVGRQESWGRAAMFAALIGLAVGLAVIGFAYVPPALRDVLLVCAMITGALVALDRPLPELGGCAIGLVIGAAVALDSPPQAVSVREANLTLIGTALSAGLLLVLVVEIASRLTGQAARTGARILGAWIAASAILMLALRIGH